MGKTGSSSCIGCNSQGFPLLIVIRGNSASGKSSVAAGIRTRYGRGLSIVSQDNLRRVVLREHGDDEHALRVARQIHTGTIGANVSSTFVLTSPLGGVRQSGLGRRYGEQGFEEYLEVKAIGVPA